MKKIALDLAGVVFDLENSHRVYAEIQDIDHFHKDYIINTCCLFQGQYNWDRDECICFYNANTKEDLTTDNFLSRVKIVLKRLLNYFEIIVVTARMGRDI